MKNMPINDLRKMFVSMTKKWLAKQERKLLFMLDSYNSFESWVSWELAFAFAFAHPWPEWGVLREAVYEFGGRSDLLLYRVPSDQDKIPPASECCRIEVKLIWANKNQGKMARQALSDARRLKAANGANGLIVIYAGADKERYVGLNGDPQDLQKRIEQKIFQAALQGEPLRLLRGSRNLYTSPHAAVVWYAIDSTTRLPPPANTRALATEPS